MRFVCAVGVNNGRDAKIAVTNQIRSFRCKSPHAVREDRTVICVPRVVR